MRLPDETPDGVPESVWLVTPRGGAQVILRFGRFSGLPRSVEIRLPFNRLIRHFDDWRRVGDGVLVAWEQRDEDPEDESLEKITVTSVQTNRSSPPGATFTQPPQPSDSAILGIAPSSTVAYEDDS